MLIQINFTLLFCYCAYQLNQNMKTVNQSMNRIQLTLKDNSVIMLDKLPPTLVQRTKEYLEKLKKGKTGNCTLCCGTLSTK